MQKRHVNDVCLCAQKIFYIRVLGNICLETILSLSASEAHQEMKALHLQYYTWSKTQKNNCTIYLVRGNNSCRLFIVAYF